MAIDILPFKSIIIKLNAIVVLQLLQGNSIKDAITWCSVEYFNFLRASENNILG